MHDICIVCTFDRPEMLMLSLSHLAQTEEVRSHQVEIWVCVDRHARPISGSYYRDHVADLDEIDRALGSFGDLRLRKILRSETRFHGLTRNAMEAYKEAHRTDARYVFNVEDDVLVTPDFFRWHHAVQSSEDLFCSIAWKNRRRNDYTQSDDPRQFFTSRTDYASVGVCFKREKLSCILPHAHDGYYSNLSKYVAREFSENPVGPYTEQAGLIRRLLIRSGGKSAWPYVPRAYHIGWYGYHRPSARRPVGDLMERYGELQRLLTDIDALDKAKEGVRYNGDVEVPRQMTHWDSLECVERLT